MILWLKLYFPDDVVFLFTFNIFVVKCLYSEFCWSYNVTQFYIENHSENCLPFGTPLGCDICYCLPYIRLLSEICLNQLALVSHQQRYSLGSDMLSLLTYKVFNSLFEITVKFRNLNYKILRKLRSQPSVMLILVYSKFRL